MLAYVNTYEIGIGSYARAVKATVRKVVKMRKAHGVRVHFVTVEGWGAIKEIRF